MNARLCYARMYARNKKELQLLVTCCDNYFTARLNEIEEENKQRIVVKISNMQYLTIFFMIN